MASGNLPKRLRICRRKHVYRRFVSDMDMMILVMPVQLQGGNPCCMFGRVTAFENMV
jgi:hypothetical protein